MNYRGKDKLAEALKNGLLEKREPKASVPIDTVVVNIAEAQAIFEEKVAKPTSKNIDLVAGALKPKRAPWAQKLYEENKPAPKPVVAPAPAKKKVTLEFMKESVSGLKPEIDTSKKAIKAEVLAENISEINAAIAFNNSRNYKPAKTETLEEKVNRLEELLKKKLDLEEANPLERSKQRGLKNKAEKKAKKIPLQKATVSDFLRHRRANESVEPLNELSADKLKDYMSKSVRDLADKRDNHAAAQKKSWENPKADHSDVDKQAKKIESRRDGLSTAYSKWNKKNRFVTRAQAMGESVEQLDELSAQTVSKYGDKAWLSKANAHIDRGGADYLDDDKARKKATRTIGKRERGLALAKNIMKKKDC